MFFQKESAETRKVYGGLGEGGGEPSPQGNFSKEIAMVAREWSWSVIFKKNKEKPWGKGVYRGRGGCGVGVSVGVWGGVGVRHQLCSQCRLVSTDSKKLKQ